MSTIECPEWEYDQHPGRSTTLPATTERVLREVRLGALPIVSMAADTRPLHGKLFSLLVPSGFEYYAGHYRGEHFPCLVDYEVAIRSGRDFR